MLYFLFCLALAASPAVAGPPDIAPITVYTHFDRQPEPAVAESVRQEVDSILAPLGFPLQWHSLDDARGNEISASLAVVTFRGDCRVGDVAYSGRITSPLGVTHISDGVVLPFTDIDCEATRLFLQKSLLHSPL